MLAALLTRQSTVVVLPTVGSNAGAGGSGGGAWSGKFEFSSSPRTTRIIGPRREILTLSPRVDALSLIDALQEKPVLAGLDFAAINRAAELYDAARRASDEDDDEDAMFVLLN